MTPSQASLMCSCALGPCAPLKTVGIAPVLSYTYFFSKVSFYFRRVPLMFVSHLHDVDQHLFCWRNNGVTTLVCRNHSQTVPWPPEGCSEVESSAKELLLKERGERVRAGKTGCLAPPAFCSLTGYNAKGFLLNRKNVQCHAVKSLNPAQNPNIRNILIN